MVKITNGINTFKVPKSSFKSIFKPQGYNLIESPAKSITGDSMALTEENRKDPMDELLEKPINNWSKAEVKTFASSKKINLTGTKSVSEAKEVIRNWINENL